MTYEPYKTDALLDLMKHAYRLGWFGGTHAVFTVTCSSGFEAFSGRASETWECQYTVRLNEIKTDSGKVINPQAEFKGETLNDACREALARIAALNNK